MTASFHSSAKRRGRSNSGIALLRDAGRARDRAIYGSGPERTEPYLFRLSHFFDRKTMARVSISNQRACRRLLSSAGDLWMQIGNLAESGIVSPVGEWRMRGRQALACLLLSTSVFDWMPCWGIWRQA